MDLQSFRRPGGSSVSSSLIELPEYLITTFFPGAQPLLARYPKLFRFLGILLALWYFGPVTRLQALWGQFSSLLVSTVHVSSEEDLFGYLVVYLTERRTLRADQSLNAISNPPQEGRRHRRDPEFEETSRKAPEEAKIKYEQGHGTQIFVHKKRLFYTTRKFGEGHTYHGSRYKRIEIISVTCLGRSTQPIKDLVEDIYFMNKDKERSMTIIRRPYAGGYGSRLTWSRLTSKPRRGLDTVILDAAQKEQVLADVEEYMDEATQTFYGNHGIPYRRGYLFHGPPGVGKTSFCLALAARFNLDVYVLTLLDQDLSDSDLVSLTNQLPEKSLLLLEDIDTAGLSRKKLPHIRASRRRQRGMPEGVADPKPEDLDEEETGQTSRVSLSGLLNAIDGVAAPEGHILIMTTNKPHELDDALVRAGRISVRVGFKNASKSQAEEIFLRMYVDLPATLLEETTPPLVFAPATAIASELESEKASLLPDLAKQFASLIPEFDFSPADLQDYLLIHKKDPVKAVNGIDEWVKSAYEDRKRKEEEKEVEAELKKEKRKDEKRKWRDNIKKAVEGNSEDEDDDKADKDGETAEKTKTDEGVKDAKSTDSGDTADGVEKAEKET